MLTWDAAHLPPIWCENQDYALEAALEKQNFVNSTGRLGGHFKHKNLYTIAHSSIIRNRQEVGSLPQMMNG